MKAWVRILVMAGSCCECELHTVGAFACSRPKFGKISVASTGTLGRGKEALLSSGWSLIGSELSSPNFNSSVRAELLFAIRYLNVIIQPLWGNLDICLNYYFRLRNSVRMLLVADRDRKWKMPFCISLFSCALAQFNTSKTRARECTYWSLHQKN